MKHRAIPTLSILLLLALSGRAWAQSGDCHLQQLASVDMTTEADGEVSVPMAINGHSGLMLVDTGSIDSSIAGPLALQLGLHIGPASGLFMLMGGVRIDKAATADTVQVGTMTARNLPLLVVPSTVLHSDTIGMLAPDIMQNYDVELDFAAGKFNLFSPDHCPGNVVYWTKTPYATVPLELDHGGHLLIQLMLNGKQVTAGVDTGAYRTAMTLADVQSIFGVTPNDPALKKLAVTSINGTVPTAIYHYPFTTLEFEGVRVVNPEIEIMAGDRFDPGKPQVILGVATLRQLHLYIAYGERKLYLTPAEAR